jgi:hypothetical protein
MDTLAVVLFLFFCLHSGNELASIRENADVQKKLLNTAAVVPLMIRGGFCSRIIFDVQK